MNVGTSNLLQGIIREINVGEVTAIIRIQFGEDIVESALPKAALEDMGLKVGDPVMATFESTPVWIVR